MVFFIFFAMSLSSNRGHLFVDYNRGPEIIAIALGIGLQVELID
jgi:hypothetical protein